MKPLLKRTVVLTSAALVMAGVVAGSGTAFAIVGGTDASHGYPGETAMSVTLPGVGVAHCGGALIGSRWVLTAAHCVSDSTVAPTPVPISGGQVSVRLGSTDRTRGGTVATGVQVFLHPDWEWGAPTGRPVSDLALVQLDRAVRGVPLLPIGIRPAAEGEPVRLIGWGLTAFPPPAVGDPLPTVLQQRDVTHQPATGCTGGFIGDGEICVGTGACFGDSGSPALHRTAGPGAVAGRWVSVGIASRETDDTNPCGAPDVYTDPTAFRTWIADTIRWRHVQPCTCPLLPAADSTPTGERIDLFLAGQR